MRRRTENKMKSFKFRMYPTKTQEARLDDSMNACRMLYNEFVAESRLAYKEGYRIRFDELQRMIPAMVPDGTPLVCVHVVPRKTRNVLKTHQIRA